MKLTKNVNDVEDNDTITKAEKASSFTPTSSAPLTTLSPPFWVALSGGFAKFSAHSASLR